MFWYIVKWDKDQFIIGLNLLKKMGFKNGSGPNSDKKHQFQKSQFGSFLKVDFWILNVIGLENSCYI